MNLKYKSSMRGKERWLIGYDNEGGGGGGGREREASRSVEHIREQDNWQHKPKHTVAAWLHRTYGRKKHTIPLLRLLNMKETREQTNHNSEIVQTT